MQRWGGLAAIATFVALAGCGGEPVVMGPDAGAGPGRVRVSVAPQRVGPGAVVEVSVTGDGLDSSALSVVVLDRSVQCQGLADRARCSYRVRGDEVSPGATAPVELKVMRDDLEVGATSFVLDLEPPVITEVTSRVVDASGRAWPYSMAGIDARLEVDYSVSEAASVALVSTPRDLGPAARALEGRLEVVLSERLVPNATYALRLRAVDLVGNAAEVLLDPVSVDLERPPSPTPPRLEVCRGACDGANTRRTLRTDIEAVEPQLTTIFLDGPDVLTSTRVHTLPPPLEPARSVIRGLELTGLYLAYQDEAGNFSDHSSQPGLQAAPLVVRWFAQGDLSAELGARRFEPGQRVPVQTIGEVATGALELADGQVAQVGLGEIGFEQRGTGPTGRPDALDAVVWEPSRGRLLALAAHQTWVDEGQGWRRLFGPQPSCEGGHLTHDRAREVTVLLCPRDRAWSTFEHDGTRWRERPSGIVYAPDQRGFLAYDPRAQEVAFVEQDGRTWGYDGDLWVPRVPTPSGEVVAVLADHAGGRLHLFTHVEVSEGEQTCASWSLGSDWQLGESLPGEVLGAVHDEASGQNLVWARASAHGGVQVWTGEPRLWRPVAIRGAFPTTGPVAFDGHRGALVRFGRDGERWQHVAGAWLRERLGQRLPTTWGVSAYDASRGRLVMLEDPDDAEGMSPTLHWEWDGATWTATTGFSVQGHARHFGDPTGARALLFDPTGPRLVAVAVPGLEPQTFVHDAALGWRALPTAGPTGILLLAFDSTRQRVLGHDSNGSTWTLVGDQWQHVVTSTLTPSFYRREDAVLFDDPERGQVVLATDYGGYVLRGATWSRDSSFTRPALSGTDPKIHADPARGRLVAFPGLAEYRGGAWSTPRRAAVGAAPSRYSFESVFDAARGRLLVVSTDGDSRSRFGGIWSHDGVGWREASGPSSRPEDCDALTPSGAGGALWCVHDGRTWRWQAGAWTATATTSTPRDARALAYDVAQDRLHLHGEGGSATLVAGTWQARATTPPRAFDDLWQAAHDAATDTSLALLEDRGSMWALGPEGGWAVVSSPPLDEDARLVAGPGGDVRLFTRGGAFGYAGGAWTLAPTPQGTVRDGVLDPWRGRWVVIGDGLEELDGGSYRGFEAQAWPAEARRRARLSVDAAQGEIVLAERDRPGRQWVAPDRRGARASLHLRYGLSPQAQGDAEALRVELIGGGQGWDSDGAAVPGLEVWLWRWDQATYVRVADLSNPVQAAELTSIEVPGEPAGFIGSDQTVHLFLRTRGELGGGAEPPRIDLDMLRVSVDLQPAR